MNFIRDLPQSENSNTILIDRLTKVSHFIPCRKDINSRQFRMLFMNNIYRIHRLPADITTDRNTLFTLELWKETTKALQIKRNMSTVFHPETDGRTERTNSILEQYLRAYINDQQDNWTELLPMAEFAYNNSRQETI